MIINKTLKSKKKNTFFNFEEVSEEIASDSVARVGRENPGGKIYLLCYK